MGLETRINRFGSFVSLAARKGGLVVQPRMGFGESKRMREGLLATKNANAVTVGTITVDSYTRTGDYAASAAALAGGSPLNGFPIVAHGADAVRETVRDVQDAQFPVQVRHGSPAPQDIFATMIAAGIDATEGGPVSYCLPYGRTPLRESVGNWVRSAEMLAAIRQNGREPHLETFGGCMLGQLCPPSLLVAISVLEGLFFQQRGVLDVSLSYAQQTNAGQDEEAIAALHRLATELLPVPSWHIVLYTYMGVYPKSVDGALRLLQDSAVLAARTPAARLIVKTVAEAQRIPSIAENVEALEIASRANALTERPALADGGANEVYAEARAIVDAVLEHADDVGAALLEAFSAGHIDIPYCLHPDNRGETKTYIDRDGRLRWSAIGSMPIGHLVSSAQRGRDITSSDLLAALSYVERKFDELALAHPSYAALPANVYLGAAG